MGKLNYSARKIDGLKAGQVLSKDLKKRLPPGTASKAAARDPHLEIDISAKELTDDGFAQFIDDLIECLEYRDKDHPDGVVRLTELHLQRNVLTARSLRKLARVIALSAGDLRELDLSCNEIEIDKPEQRKIWQEFLQSFSGCYMLKKLDLSRNPLGPRGLEILSRVYMQSDLDFLEADVNDVVDATTTATDIADEDYLKDRVSALRLENGKENERPAANVSKKTPSKSKPNRQSRVQSLSPGEKDITQADIKRFSCTRGLRSIPYLIISSVSMTNACAIHLASILSIHRSPEQLLAFLPSGKALNLPDIVGQCRGIIWLPNRDLGPLAQKLLEMTEMFRDWKSDTESDDELAEEDRSPSKAAGNPLAGQSPLNKADITKQRQVRKKLDIEYARLTKRVRIDVLKVEGVHSADIWSTALKMMVTCRALLLEDKDRLVDVAAEGEETMQQEQQPEEPEENIDPEIPLPHQIPAAAPVGPFHPSTEDFAVNFPTIQAASATMMTPTRAAKKEAETITPPSQTQTTRSGKGHPRQTPAVSAPPKKETWRFGLPMELWRRIIAEALGADGILNREQQLHIMRYASDWNALAHELTIKGAADHQQIWKILDSINCFTYNPTW